MSEDMNNVPENEEKIQESEKCSSSRTDQANGCLYESR